MSVDELAVMDGSQCILQLRGVRPFLSKKYDITKHPNYKYLSDVDPKNAFNIEEFIACKLKVKENNQYKSALYVMLTVVIIITLFAGLTTTIVDYYYAKRLESIRKLF